MRNKPNRNPPRIFADADEDIIAFGTAVWLRDGDGEMVDLVPHQEIIADALPGVFAPVDSDYGIARHDENDVYDSDFRAAREIGDFLVYRGLIPAPYTIWFFPSTERTSS